MKRLILLCLVMTAVLCLVGCGDSGREYHPDVTVALQDPSEKLIIKEWCFLSGSGADIYYQKDDSPPVLLGKTTGADDGFCPFKQGLFEVEQNRSAVTVKWCFDPSDNNKDNWRTKVFELPLTDGTAS